MSPGLLLRALDPRRHWLYPLVYAGTALVLLFLLSLYASVSERRPERVVFVNGSAAAALRASPGEDDDAAARSGLDMAPSLPLPPARPEAEELPPPDPPLASTPEPPPDSMPPPSDVHADWAAPDATPAPSERGDAASSSGRRALTPLDPPKAAASQAASGAVLSLGKTPDQPRHAAAGGAASLSWPNPPGGRKYRDLVGRMYGQ